MFHRFQVPDLEQFGRTAIYSVEERARQIMILEMFAEMHSWLLITSCHCPSGNVLFQASNNMKY